MKTCTSCGKRKHHSKFYVLSTGYRQPQCKDCDKARVREWQKRNPERNRDAVRRFRARNPGYDLPQTRAYDDALKELRENHRDEFERLYRKHKRRVAS